MRRKEVASSSLAATPTPQKVLKAFKQALSFFRIQRRCRQNLFSFLVIESKQFESFLFRMFESCLVSSFFPLFDFANEQQVSPEMSTVLGSSSFKSQAKLTGSLVDLIRSFLVQSTFSNLTWEGSFPIIRLIQGINNIERVNNNDFHFMGNFNSSKPYDPDLWEQVTPNLLRHYDTDEEIEIHILDLDNKQQEDDYVYDYELRRNPQPPFVRVLNYRFAKEYGCGPYQAYAYTERIFRLHELELSVPQAVYMLTEAIIAYSLLFEEYGPFYITSRMLGANQNGRVKVWISENFAENQVGQSTDITDYITEQDVVLDLAQLIDEQLDDDYLSQLLFPYEGRLNFQNALKILNVYQTQQLIKVNKIFLEKEEYNKFLAKQFLSLGNSVGVKGDAGGKKVKTTTTTTTTHHVMPPPMPTISVPPPTPMIVPSQQSRLVVPTQPLYYEINTAGSGSYGTVSPLAFQVPRAMIPYQKATGDQARRKSNNNPPRMYNRPAVNEPNPYMKPIPKVQVRHRLERVMPTTQKNEVEKKLEREVRENFNKIARVESRIVVASNTPKPQKPPTPYGFDRRNVELTESMILENLKALH